MEEAAHMLHVIPISVVIPIGVALFNLVALIVGLAVVWGKFSAQFSEFGKTVENVNKILHPDPARSGDRLMTVADCINIQKSCQSRICAKIDDLKIRIESMEATVNQASRKRRSDNEVHEERWRTIESFMEFLKEHVREDLLKDNSGHKGLNGREA